MNLRELVSTVKIVRNPVAFLLALSASFGTAQQAHDSSTPDLGAGESYDFSTAVGPHHRRIETVVQEFDPAGNPVQRLSHYTEVATGLNYLDEQGTWQRTVENIDPHPEGAAALFGYYKVIFKRQLHQSGAIRLITPEGKEVKNHPLGLYY